jgi:hypothetical protein
MLRGREASGQVFGLVVEVDHRLSSNILTKGAGISPMAAQIASLANLLERKPWPAMVSAHASSACRTAVSTGRC